MDESLRPVGQVPSLYELTVADAAKDDLFEGVLYEFDHRDPDGPVGTKVGWWRPNIWTAVCGAGVWSAEFVTGWRRVDVCPVVSRPRDMESERDRWARLYARKSDDYDEIGMGVMEKIADGGSLADVLHFVADHLDSRDNVDDGSQALYERAAAALSSPRVQGELPFDLVAHLDRQRRWSEATFGPGDRAKGIVAHLRKELVEVEAAPGDLTEWIDVVILAFDGAWRSGAAPGQIIDALVAKQARNEARAWPDWRTADPDGPIEHVRTAHLRGCQAQQGVGLPCNCDSPGTVDGIAGDAPCATCGRDNRNGTHAALEMVGHLSHEYRPGGESVG